MGATKAPPAGQNYSRYCNPKVDALVAEYNRTYDEDDRAKLISRVAHIINDEVPIIVPTIGREDMLRRQRRNQELHTRMHRRRSTT